jgi:hypothetical protein
MTADAQRLQICDFRSQIARQGSAGHPVNPESAIYNLKSAQNSACRKIPFRVFYGPPWSP